MRFHRILIGSSRSNRKLACRARGRVAFSQRANSSISSPQTTHSTQEVPMVKSTATTVEEYLSPPPPPDRREALTTVLEVIRKNLPAVYAEGINWGMIAFEVPLTRYPKTYNKQPLAYAALAAQKNHLAIYPPLSGRGLGSGGRNKKGICQGWQDARHGQILHPVHQPRRSGPGRHWPGDRRDAGGRIHRTLRGEPGEEVTAGKSTPGG